MPKPLPSGAGVCVGVAAAIPQQSQRGGGGRVTLQAGRGEGGDSGVVRGPEGRGRAAAPPGSRLLSLAGVPPGGPGNWGMLGA